MHQLPSKTSSLTPMERVLLLNDGTNQLLLSAYFNDKIRVLVQRQRENTKYIDRTSILIKTDNTVVCYAETRVYKMNCSSVVLNKVRDRKTALGDIIKSSKESVRKKIISLGKKPGMLFRKYEIKGGELRFVIKEEFPISAFEVGAVEK